MTAPAVSAPPAATGRLALALQEAITAVARLRADSHPIADVGAFRAQMAQLFARADQEGRALGYDPADVRLAVFAVVAFLDESALNTRQSAFADWARRPLQDELFGGHLGGEWFFQHITQLLDRPDTPALVDVLEVYQLCLLLGFRGRYGASDGGELHAVAARVAERIHRARGAPGDLAPAWRPPTDVMAERDPWLRRLAIGAVAAAVLALALWGAYTVSLRGADASLRALAAPSASAPAS
jgi:type VI secretion system protein ImpK